MNEGCATPEKSLDTTVLKAEITALKTQLGALTQQLDWFKRQLFGRKSERRFGFGFLRRSTSCILQS